MDLTVTRELLRLITAKTDTRAALDGRIHGLAVLKELGLLWSKSAYRTLPLRMALFVRDRGHCQDCGRELDFRDIHIVHRVPKAKGGSSKPDNLRVLCQLCNCLKRDSGATM